MLTFDPDLQEIAHGDWEGLLASEISIGHPELLRAWRESPESVLMPGEGGESRHARSSSGWPIEISLASSPSQSPCAISCRSGSNVSMAARSAPSASWAVRTARDSGDATARITSTLRSRSPSARACASPTGDSGMSRCPW